MAEQKAVPKATPTPTSRVVLMAVTLPASQVVGAVPEERKGLVPVDGDGDDSITVWVYVGMGTGDNRQAIKGVTKETPGMYRAPSERSWHGGVGWRPPDQVRLEGFGFD